MIKKIKSAYYTLFLSAFIILNFFIGSQCFRATMQLLLFTLSIKYCAIHTDNDILGIFVKQRHISSIRYVNKSLIRFIVRYSKMYNIITNRINNSIVYTLIAFVLFYRIISCLLRKILDKHGTSQTIIPRHLIMSTQVLVKI